MINKSYLLKTVENVYMIWTVVNKITHKDQSNFPKMFLGSKFGKKVSVEIKTDSRIADLNLSSD